MQTRHALSGAAFIHTDNELNASIPQCNERRKLEWFSHEIDCLWWLAEAFKEGICKNIL